MRKYFTILLLCFLPLSLLAQSGVSTSLFTGRMSYTIPIYTIEDPDFHMDIALRYSSEGFKPFQPSGCYGQDWSLIAGGCITRQVMGMPDEASYFKKRKFKIKGVSDPWAISSSAIYNLGRARSYNNLKKEDVFDFKLDKRVYADSLGIRYRGHIEDYYGLWAEDWIDVCDYMPDIFHFNFCGYKGSFMINNAGKAVILSGDFVEMIDIGEDTYIARSTTKNRDNTIEYPQKSMEKQNSKIRIRTRDGYIYTFGIIGYEKYKNLPKYKAGSLAYSVAVNKNGLIDETFPVINAWYLAAIASPNGRTIVLKYKMDENDNVPNNLCSLVTGYDWTEEGDGPHINYSLQRNCLLESITTSDSIPLRISFKSREEAHRMYDDRAHSWSSVPNLQLDSIIVTGGNRVLKTAAFSYVYHSQSTASGSFNWRYLQSVTVSGVGKYLMTYNSLDINQHIETGVYERLTNYPSLDVQTDSEYRSIVDRFGFMKVSPLLSMLSQVTLPTGGHIKFTYGTHEYGKERRYKKYNCWCDVTLESITGANTPIGGARIEKIETYSDAETPAETKTFTYMKANTSNSSGIYYNIYEIYDNPSCPYFDGKEKVQITHPYNYNMITSHIGYSYVEQETSVGSEKSKTTFSFDTGTENYVSYAYRGSYNQSNKWINFKGVDGWRAAEELRSGSLMYAGNLTAPGKLIKTDSFVGDRKVKSVQFRYNNGATRTTGHNGVSETVNALGIVDTIVCLSTYSAHVARKLFVCPDVLEKITTQEFDANGQMMETVQNIKYDKKLRKKEVKTTDGGSKQFFTKYTYREEVPDSLYMKDLFWLKDYASLMNRPIETITGYKENNKEYITNGVVVFYGKKDYKSDFSVSTWSLRLSEPLPAANYQWYKQGHAYMACDPNYVLSKEYKFDEEKRLISEKPFGETETTYTWNGLYPATKTKDNQTWKYEYIPYVGIKSQTDPRGNTTYYEYDANGRLKEEYTKDEHGNKQILNIYQYHIKSDKQQ